MANWDSSHFQQVRCELNAPFPFMNFLDADAVLRFRQMLINFDPFETGFVDWRRFLMVQSKVLPVSKDRIAQLKLEYSALDPENRGQVFILNFFPLVFVGLLVLET
jgi:hypothetical protein